MADVTDVGGGRARDDHGQPEPRQVRLAVDPLAGQDQDEAAEQDRQSRQVAEAQAVGEEIPRVRAEHAGQYQESPVAGVDVGAVDGFHTAL
jgi:hypothetical protein